MVRERGRGLFTAAASEVQIITASRSCLRAGASALRGRRAGRPRASCRAISRSISVAAHACAAIAADRRRLGRPINGFDAQIMAITPAAGGSLATRDTLTSRRPACKSPIHGSLEPKARDAKIVK
jgi:predicted nucleic acid-binding protein